MCRARECGPSQTSRETRSRLLVSAAVEPLHKGVRSRQCDQRTADQGPWRLSSGATGAACSSRISRARVRRAEVSSSRSTQICVRSCVGSCVMSRGALCPTAVDNRLAPHESGDQCRVLIAGLSSTSMTRVGPLRPSPPLLTTAAVSKHQVSEGRAPCNGCTFWQRRCV